MSRRKTKFNDSWLQVDSSLKDWAQPVKSDCYKFYCKYCLKSGTCANGIKDLRDHATTQKHRNVMKECKTSGKLEQFQFTSSSSGGSNNSFETDAEILLTLNAIEQNWSFHSVASLPEILKRIFSDASKITLGKDKLSYLTVHGLKPHFEELLKKQLTDRPFSIFVDEASDGDRSFLCIIVRFTDEKSLEVSTRLLKLVPLQSSKAIDILNALMKCLREFKLEETNLVSVMTDNCHVMRGEHGGLFTLVKNTIQEKIIDVHGCTLHLVHISAKHAFNAMKTAEMVADCVNDLHSYFSNSPKHSAELKKIAEHLDAPLKKMLRHVETRWLQMLPVIERILQQYEVIIEFVKNTTDSSRRFQRISAVLKNPLFLPTLHFMKFVIGKMQSFEKLFQTDGIVIHTMFDKLCEMLVSLLVLCVRESCINRKRPWKTDFKNDANKMPANEIIIGDETRSIVSTLSDRNRIVFFVEVVRPYYEALLEKMIGSLPFEKKALKYLRFLDPSSISSKQFTKNVTKFAKMLPRTVFPDGHIEELTVELRTLRLTMSDAPFPPSTSVETAWPKLLLEDKYPLFRRVVTAALCLPHGNATVERQFSAMADVLTKKRNLLHDETLDAILFVKNSIAYFGGVAHMIVTPSMRVSCRNAHAKFTEATRLRLAQEQRERIERAEKELTDHYSVALRDDIKMKTLVGKQANAATLVSDEKKKIERKDRLIAELIATREEDKLKYEKALKEKENLEKLSDRRKRNILDSVIAAAAAKHARVDLNSQ